MSGAEWYSICYDRYIAIQRHSNYYSNCYRLARMIRQSEALRVSRLPSSHLDRAPSAAALVLYARAAYFPTTWDVPSSVERLHAQVPGRGGNPRPGLRATKNLA